MFQVYLRCFFFRVDSVNVWHVSDSNISCLGVDAGCIILAAGGKVRGRCFKFIVQEHQGRKAQGGGSTKEGRVRTIWSIFFARVVAACCISWQISWLLWRLPALSQAPCSAVVAGALPLVTIPTGRGCASAAAFTARQAPLTLRVVTFCRHYPFHPGCSSHA